MLKVTGSGITVKDVELRYSKNGKAYAYTTIVNNEEYKGEKIGHFTNLVAWGDVAEDLAEEVEKGCLVEIEGILKHPVRTKDGVTYYNTEVVVFDFEMKKKFEPKTPAQGSKRRSRRSKK